ncbi:hypothetical protein Celaphus_00010775, partial [Cervus elaphus hippelaphus]
WSEVVSDPPEAFWEAASEQSYIPLRKMMVGNKEYPEGCEQVIAGKKLLQCLSSPEEVKLALEVYKLSLEIALLELQIDKRKDASEW